MCDSRSLTAHRQLLGASEPPVGLRKLKAQLELFRVRATESRLPDRFRCVTTISEPDRRQLLELHGPADNVHVVPNGVGDGLLKPLGPRGTRRGVAFWGNLAFGPNDEALRFFVDKVYLPFLVAHDVELYVVGASAPLWLIRTAEREPRITVAGFVPDLAAAVGDYPLMINPMRTGSGLKNKVLEAFGLGLVVLTTRLGVDALPAARDDEHLVMADEPEAMSRAVLDLLADDARRERLRRNANSLLRSNYPWAVIGREWRALFAWPSRTPIRHRGGRFRRGSSAGGHRAGRLLVECLPSRGEAVQVGRRRLHHGAPHRAVDVRIGVRLVLHHLHVRAPVGHDGVAGLHGLGQLAGPLAALDRDLGPARRHGGGVQPVARCGDRLERGARRVEVGEVGGPEDLGGRKGVQHLLPADLLAVVVELGLHVAAPVVTGGHRLSTTAVPLSMEPAQATSAVGGVFGSAVATALVLGAVGPATVVAGVGFVAMDHARMPPRVTTTPMPVATIAVRRRDCRPGCWA